MGRPFEEKTFDELNTIVGTFEQRVSGFTMGLRKMIHSTNIRYNPLALDAALWARRKDIGLLLKDMEKIEQHCVTLIQRLGISPLEPLQAKEEEPHSLHAVYQRLFQMAQNLEGESGATAYYDEALAFLRQSPTGRQVVEEYEQGAVPHGE